MVVVVVVVVGAKWWLLLSLLLGLIGGCWSVLVCRCNKGSRVVSKLKWSLWWDFEVVLQ